MTDFISPTLDRLCPPSFDEMDPAQRAAYLVALADLELAVALEAEPRGDQIALRGFDLPEGKVALLCEDEGQLAEFLGGPTDYATLPGRALAALLAGQGWGALVNPLSASQALLPPESLGWLVEEIAGLVPPTDVERPVETFRPDQESCHLLEQTLALRGEIWPQTAGAFLLGACWADGRHGHMLVLTGIAVPDRPAMAKTVAELLALGPEIAGGVDLFFESGAPPVEAEALTLRFAPTKPHPSQPASSAPRGPGLDPEKPPILRF